MKKTFFFLLLTFCSSFAWAEAPPVDVTPVLSHTDLSMTYLGMIFGTLGSSFHGVSGQMLGMLFYQFNIGVMAVMGSILGYSTILTTVRVASEGLANSQQRNISLLGLRIALGFGAVIPNPSTGYSPIQVALAAVVVKSVQLADVTWSYGLNYVQHGGSLWQDPNNALSNANNAKTGLLGSSPGNFKSGVIPKIFANLYCTYKKTVDNADSSGSANAVTVSGISAVAPSTPSFPVNCEGSIKCNTITFAQSCGKVNALTTVNLTDSASKADQANARLAVQAVVDSVAPAVKAWYCVKNGNKADFCGNSSLNAAKTLLETSFVDAYLGYLNGIQPILREASPGVSNTSFIDKAKAQGWASAGRFYFDLSTLSQDLIQSTNPAKNIAPTGVACKPTTCTSTGYHRIGNFPLSSVTKLLAKASNTQMTASASEVSSLGQDGIQGGLGLVADLIPFMSPILTTAQALTDVSNTQTDPILLLSNIGYDLLNIAGTLLGAAFTAAIAFGLAGMANVCGNLSADAPWRDALPFIKSIVMTGVFFFTVSGIMFAFYTPLYPFIVYTFAVLGWLAVVIEAMIAAPLIALGLTHPEGHDFLGQSQQAMMLMVAVFLRPVLVVIGLIISMIVSYVALKIINYGFSGIILSIGLGLWGGTSGTFGSAISHTGNVGVGVGIAEPLLLAYHNSAGVGGFLLRLLIVLPAFICLYALIVYQVINQSFRLISDIPNGVFKWIGVQAQLGGQAFNPAEATRGIEGSAQGGIGKAAASGERAYQKGQDARKAYLDAKAKQDKENEGGSTNIGNGDG